MIFKLSEKGCSKLGKVFQGFPLPPHIFIRLLGCEFGPDDFESPPCSFENQGIESEKGSTSHHDVRLTVEEAKWLYKCARIEFARLLNEHAHSDLIEKVEKVTISLRDKIEQTEAKCSNE